MSEDYSMGLESGGYASIAHADAALVERTGLLGQGGSWAGRQMVARFFIAGFGNAAQRAAWLPRFASGERMASVAISEPRIGAHPKLLTTRAEADGDSFRITGEKAWVSNGPLAAVFVVLAVMAIEDGRKRYGAFLVPRETPGLTIRETPDTKPWRRRAIAAWCSMAAMCPHRRYSGRPAPLTKRWRCRSAMQRTRSAHSGSSVHSASCSCSSVHAATPANRRCCRWAAWRH